MTNSYSHSKHSAQTGVGLAGRSSRTVWRPRRHWRWYQLPHSWADSRHRKSLNKKYTDRAEVLNVDNLFCHASVNPYPIVAQVPHRHHSNPLRRQNTAPTPCERVPDSLGIWARKTHDSEVPPNPPATSDPRCPGQPKRQKKADPLQMGCGIRTPGNPFGSTKKSLQDPRLHKKKYLTLTLPSVSCCGNLLKPPQSQQISTAAVGHRRPCESFLAYRSRWELNRKRKRLPILLRHLAVSLGLLGKGCRYLDLLVVYETY